MNLSQQKNMSILTNIRILKRTLLYIVILFQILMIYNRDVTEVEFHLTDTVDQDNVVSALQRKLEYWSGTACPRWSRFAVAGFSIHDIPHHRRKRSLERSRSRNKVKKAMKEWELDWIKKM